MFRSFVGVVLLTTVVFLGGGAAAAQDGPAISADPASVEAPGSVDVTVTGTGFTTDGFLLSCAGLEGNVDGALSADGSECDLAALTPYAVDDAGGWTATATFDIPAEGLVLVAGNADQTESARVLVSVGAAAETTAEDGGEEELANTGVESAALVVIAGAVIIAGGMLAATQRRRLTV